VKNKIFNQTLKRNLTPSRC